MSPHLLTNFEIQNRSNISYSLKMFGCSATTVSNEEMNDIMKIVKPLEKSGLLIKGVNGTIKNEPKEVKGGFLRMSLGKSQGRVKDEVQLEQLEVHLEQMKAQLEQASIFNVASSFNKFWNTK